MTKYELEQLGKLNREAEHLQLKIDQLKSQQEQITTDVVSGSMSEFPYVKHSIVIDGLSPAVFKSSDFQRYQLQIKILQSRLEAKKDQCVQKLLEIYEWLDTIQDSRLRDIFMLRYVNNLCWKQIAFSIGEHDESYPRRKHNEFLKLAEFTENKIV